MIGSDHNNWQARAISPTAPMISTKRASLFGPDPAAAAAAGG
jgi:hypothetical protein